MKLYEPFAGIGAYSLECLWQAAGSDPRMRAEPPVSRVGNKAGFVRNALRAFGLVRQKWDEVHLNDLDAVCHLFHLLYASSELRDLVARRLWALVPCPECLPLEVNAALDGQLKPTPEICLRRRNERFPVWTTTEEDGLSLDHKTPCAICSGTGVMDARQLWERIRKEPVEEPITLLDLAWLIAKALFLQSRSFQLKPVSIVGWAWEEHGWKSEIDTRYRQRDGHVVNEDSPRWTVAERVQVLPGRWVGLFESGTRIGPLADYKPEVDGTSQWNPRWTAAQNVSLLPGPGACQIGITRMDAMEFAKGVKWGKDCVCVLDPPYEGTTGYQATSCRADVLEIAQMAHDGGSLVILHEGVGLAKELGKGWHERSASPMRARGSTFHASGVEKEWLTFNRPVVWWPAIQESMFK